MPRPPATLAALGLLVLAHAPATGQDFKGGKPITVAAEPLQFSRVAPHRTRFGKLDWRGGLVLNSSDRRFGGFSGLEISADGAKIVAVSDQGWWLGARLQHHRRNLSGIEQVTLAPLLAANGKRSHRKNRRDAEALAAFDARRLKGPLLVGFEGAARLELFDLPGAGFAATPIDVAMPEAISKGPGNGELESALRLHEGPFAGWFVVVSEQNFDRKGNIRGWRWLGGETVEFTIARHEDYRITDIAALPGGDDIVTLERSFSPGSLPGMALRRLRLKDLKSSTAARGSLLVDVRQPIYAIDNMEGLAVHRTADGEIRLTLLSDDNYNRTIQKTLLLQFALED